MEKKYGLARLNPTLRFLVFVGLCTLFTFAWNWPTTLIAVALGVLLLLAGRKYPKAAIIACLSAGVLTFLGNAFGAQEDIVFDFLVKASRQSLLEGLRMGLRVIGMILPAIAFIAVTPLHEFLQISRGLRLPPAAEMYLTIVLRYVDILWYEINTSMKAMAMRGVDWEGGVSQKVRAFSSLMLPLIYRIFDHVEGQSLAIDSRGGVVYAKRADTQPIDAADAVQFENVSVRYNLDEGNEAPPAVDDLSLTLTRGSTTVLLGHTGAGKTSTMLLSTGLIPRSTGHMLGDVRLFGVSTKTAGLNYLGKHARIVLTSAVQGLVGLTVRDELLISLRVCDLPKEQREESMVNALNSVGLNASFLERMTLGLSGGEMQRVAVASAIVANPSLLALDDVTMQLDPRGKREVIGSLENLSQDQTTKLISDSHIGLLEEIGTRFINLEEGKLIADEAALGWDNLTASGLRIPQLWQLGRLLGRDLSQFPEKAIPVLSSLPHRERPVFTPASVRKDAVVLRAVGIEYQYSKGPKALKGVSMELRKGEFVAVLGSNGSGKTTLALILAGAMKPTAGEIWIEGVRTEGKAIHGKVGYVFQEPVNQMVTMKVKDELEFAPRQLGWDEDAIQQATAREAERFGLDLDAVPLRLQPAEARKVCIAATLAMAPKVVFLDEPTNNLDSADVDQMMRHMKDLQAAGTTVVMISHDLEVVLRYADRLVVLQDGNVIADGPTREVAAKTELLAGSDLIMPPVVVCSLALWPDSPPALTVDELADQFK